MQDFCTITRPQAPQVDALGREHTPKPRVVYEGKCKIQTYEPYEQVLETVQHSAVQQRYSVHIPYGAGPFEVGDIIALAGSDRKFRVGGLHEKTYQTAIRLLVDEVVA